MAEPNSKATFKEYIKRKLGAPVLEINVDDDQFDDRMDEALQYFREYHYDGSIKTYLKHQITQAEIDSFKTNETHNAATTGTQAISGQTYGEGQNYITLPEHVLSVINIFPFNSGQTSSMFDIQYQLRLNDLWDLTSTSVLYYSQVQSHLSMLNDILVGQIPIRYNMHSNRLYMDYSASKLSAGEYIIIECYRKLDPTENTDVFNDMYLKRYVTSLFKKQWGTNLSKFGGVQMIGGVTLNGLEIYQQANQEIQTLEDQIRGTFESPVTYMVG